MKGHREYAVVDVFCGVGGLAHGFVLENNFNVIAGIDSDKSCEFAFKNNNKAEFICEDITKIDVTSVSKLFPQNSVKILVGCAPCQPFSRHTSGVNKVDKNTKWELLLSFGKLVEAIQPDIISVENVPQLARYNKNGVYSKFLKILIDNGYHISDPDKIVSCPAYGVPQNRKRLVLLGSKFGDIKLIDPVYAPSQYPTVRQSIGDLPKIDDGIDNLQDPMHRSQKLSELNKRRMRETKQGGSWRDWPDELKLKCHKNLKGSTFGDVYGRMRWDEPSPTLTTHCIGLGNGRFGHPEQDRAISLREAAMLQSFPVSYNFIDPSQKKIVYKDIQRHIGNAVPVKLGQAIAKSISQHLEKYLNS